MNSDVTTVSLIIKMIQAVIFDMDGVIIDSEPVYEEWLRNFLRSENIAASELEIKSMVGISSQNYKKNLESWWIRAGKPLPNEISVYEMFDQFCDNYFLSYSKIQDPDVEEVMRTLTEMNIQVAVASSSSMKDINKVLQETKLDKYVDVKVSGADFKESKPNPEIYHFTVDKLRCNNLQCVAIEDSVYGIQAAVNAGIKVLAKKDDRFGFDQSQADYQIDSLNQVIEIISSLNKGM